jgi:hypothetical protein
MFVLERANSKVFVVAGAGVVRSILKAAHRSSSRYGLQTVPEIARAIPVNSRTSKDLLLVRQVLATREDLRWLDPRQQWFWLASVPRNPVVGCIKKLLQYASPLGLGDIERATKRLPRKRATPIPRQALIGFCRQAPFCRTDSDFVELVGSLGSAKLGEAEAKVCRILKRNKNELKFGCLETLSAAVGVTQSNLWRIVQYSPLIFRKAPRLYRLVTPRPNGADTLNARSA